MTERQERFLELYRRGLNDREIADALYVSRGIVRHWREKQHLKSNVPAYSNREQSRTLCWDCRNALLGCSWSKHFIPVEGWDATPHMLYANDKKHVGVQSYEVHDCPEYVPDPPREPVLPGPTPLAIKPPPARDPCVGCNNFGLCSNRGWTCKDKATWEVQHG